MSDYTRLQVWQRADTLAKGVYRLVRTMQRSERGEVGDQLRRSALSVPTNIAEGCGRGGAGDLSRYLKIALGSATEVHYLLSFARDLEIIPEETAAPLIDEAFQLRRMLGAFTRNLQTPK